MNYGKTAYLKVLDLEKKLQNQMTSKIDSSSYLELSRPNVKESFLKGSDLSLDFAPFEVYSGKNLCFQVILSISSASVTNVTAHMVVDGVDIYQETKPVSAAAGELNLIKTYTPLADGQLSLKLVLSTASQVPITCDSVSLVVLGASGKAAAGEVEVRAMRVQGKVLVSYVDSGKLYYLLTDPSEQTLSLSDFTFLLPSISHCFVEGDNGATNLLNVDPSHNLYFYADYTTLEGRLLATDVKKVFAYKCPSSFDDTNIILFVKQNGRCYYTSQRGGNFLNQVELALPEGEYEDIKAVTHEDSQYVYLVATAKSGSSYIMRSLIEVSTGKIVELLEATYLLAVRKYIDLGFAKDKLCEHISLSGALDLKSKFRYTETIESLAKEHLQLAPSVEATKYKVIPPIIYGVDLDCTQYRDPYAWATYVDDCADFEPAIPKPEENLLIDNGWLDRWPYNEIKPCVIKDGEVIGYLDPNDYTKFADGSPADITNPSFGEVMVEFPKMYFKLSQTDRTAHIKLSNTYHEGYCGDAFVYKGKEYDKIYISAYLCGTTTFANEGFHSYSGSSLNYTKSSLPYSLWKAFTEHPTGQNFEMLPYHVMNTLIVLYIIMFKTTLSSNYYSQNFTTSKIKYTTGTNTNDKGMYYCHKKYQTPNKLFGLEGLFGSRPTLVVGFAVDASKNFKVADVHDENCSFHYSDAANFKMVEGDYVRPDESAGATIDLLGFNDTGFFHSIETNKVTYEGKLGFCGGTRVDKNANSILFSYFAEGDRNAETYTNITAMAAVNEYFSTKSCSVRLVYYKDK